MKIVSAYLLLTRDKIQDLRLLMGDTPRDFIDRHRSRLNLMGIAKAAGVPYRTFTQWYREDLHKDRPRWSDRLIRVLRELGYYEEEIED